MVCKSSNFGGIPLFGKNIKWNSCQWLVSEYLSCIRRWLAHNMHEMSGIILHFFPSLQVCWTFPYQWLLIRIMTFFPCIHLLIVHSYIIANILLSFWRTGPLLHSVNLTKLQETSGMALLTSCWTCLTAGKQLKWCHQSFCWAKNSNIL